VQDSGRDLVVESENFAFNSLDLVEEPKPFVEAYNNPIEVHGCCKSCSL
jgi:hypothetical protein